MHDSDVLAPTGSQRQHGRLLPTFITTPQPRHGLHTTSPGATAPAPTLLIHRLNPRAHSSSSKLSTLVQRDVTSVGDALQFARDEEALVSIGESEEGCGLGSANANGYEHGATKGKLKAKRNQDRNWWPCGKCKEKKVKCVRINPEHKDSVCKRCQESGMPSHCKPYNQHPHSTTQQSRNLSHRPVNAAESTATSLRSAGKCNDTRRANGFEAVDASLATRSQARGTGEESVDSEKRMKYLDRLDNHSTVAFKLSGEYGYGYDHGSSNLPRQRTNAAHSPRHPYSARRVPVQIDSALAPTSFLSSRGHTESLQDAYARSWSPRPRYTSAATSRPVYSTHDLDLPPANSRSGSVRASAVTLSPTSTVGFDSDSDSDVNVDGGNRDIDNHVPAGVGSQVRIRLPVAQPERERSLEHTHPERQHQPQAVPQRKGPLRPWTPNP